MNSGRFSFNAIAAAVLVSLSGSVGAATYSYNLSSVFQGNTAPPGSPPWATLSFSDMSGADAGSVEVKLSLSGLPSTSKTTDLFINYVNDPMTLSFSNLGGQAYNTVALGTDSEKADGTGGLYDVRFRFLSGEIGRAHV